MKIAVLGSGCPTCKKLHQNVLNVVKNKAIDAEVEYSTDIKRIVELGLMMSPVLTVDGKPVTLKSTSEKDIKDALSGIITEPVEMPSCSCGGKC